MGKRKAAEALGDTEMHECSCNKPTCWVGLDFGCTHSGFSLFRQRNCRLHFRRPDIKIDRTLVTQNKFPTVLTSRHDTFSFKRNIDEVTAFETRVENFKLLFMDNRSKKLQAETTKSSSDLQQLVESVKAATSVDCSISNVENMAAVYLRGLWMAAKSYAERRFGESKDSLQIVVSYPAVFDGDAELGKRWSKVLSAAFLEDAAIVKSFPEHRAALNAALLSKDGALWKAQHSKEAVVVIDCGGMTLDAVLYDVEQDTCIASQSRPMGSVWIDQEVSDHASKWIGKKLAKADSAERNKTLQMIQTRWQRKVKPNFNSESCKKSDRISVSRDLTYTYDGEKIHAAFLKIAQEIVDISAQFLEEKPEGDRTQVVVLTGGLANSPFIREVVPEKLKEYGANITVEICKDPWNAVSLGAALFNVEPSDLYRNSLSKE